MPLEILGRNFEYPKNLKDLSVEQREALHRRWLASTEPSIADDVAVRPSGLVTDEQIEERRAFKARSAAARAVEDPEVRNAIRPQFEWDPELGYVVEGEDYSVVSSLDIDESAMKSIMKPGARPVTNNEADRIWFASLGAVDREIEERFGDL